jgi:predicted ester cyclase
MHISRKYRGYNAFQTSCFRISQGWLILTLAVAPVLSLSIPAIANPSVSMEKRLMEQNKAVALRFAQEGWGTNPGWEKVWDQLVSPNLIHHFNSAPKPIIGLEANKEFNKGLFQGFPNINQKIEDVIVEGNKVVYRTTIEGTNTGEFLGTPPTGKSVKVNDFTLLRISGGRIVEMWYETNLLEVMQQLGVIPREIDK